jgi:hypothetical protein
MSSPQADAPTLFLFEWNAEAAATRAAGLRAAGWQVETESGDIGRGVRRVLDLKPVVVVLDLARRSSYSREAAMSIRGFRASRRQMLVFVDGTKDEQKRIAECVLDPIFVVGETLVQRLDGLRD